MRTYPAMKGYIMTEQTVSETPVVETSETPVPEQKKRFRFTRKQMYVAAGTAAAAVAVIALKVKSNASKHADEADETSPEATETDASV